MSRDLDPALVTEVTAAALRPVLLTECLFDSGTVRFWNGLGNLTALGDVFTGAANLLAISDYDETQRLEAQGLTLTLSGISSSILAIALAEPYQGRQCKVYIGALNAAGALVSDPYQIFSGFMDVMEITESGDTCTIAVKAENKLLLLSRTKERRYTAEDQKAEYPGDQGFDFVTSLQNKDIVWKAKA